MSRCLTERSIDHVVIERADVANSWSTERWDSLCLLTPNWQCRLPGYHYEGTDPDGFMASAKVVDFIQGYADFISAPVHTQTTVRTVRPNGNGYQVLTDQGDWACRRVVLATGAFNKAHVPRFADSIPQGITQYTPLDYRNPEQLEPGGVLVVGASATGLQLADEIHRSGRPVTLAVGEHVRLPRVYRGRDILWWMLASGVMDERYDEVDDIVRARSVPSPQLAGSAERSTLDLNTLTDRGVKLVGRFAGVSAGKGQFAGSLRNVCALADLKMNRLLNTVDEWATESGTDDDVEVPHRFEPTRVEESPPLFLDLTKGNIRSIVWATGFLPDYSWLDVPVLDRKGRIRHDGGVVDSAGMYVLGLNFLRRRKSSFMHGAEDDVTDLSNHLVSSLDRN